MVAVRSDGAGAKRKSRRTTAPLLDSVGQAEAGLTTTGHGATLAGIAYKRLLEDIIWARLQPGQKLRMGDLKSKYGLGHSPLREALNRLHECGMVVREDNKGFAVGAISAEKLDQLMRARCWLEEIGLRESIKHGDAAWEEKVVVAHHWLSRTKRAESDEVSATTLEWETQHQRFHVALISACRSPQLIHFCAVLQDQTLRYRNLAAMTNYRLRHENTEHDAIKDAVLERDADRAVELLVSHYDATLKLVNKALQYPPG
jgi:DNA-binding GntR family transcriptional regulator